MHADIQKVLLDEVQIRDAVERLGASVAARFAGERLLVVSVLKGSCIFFADLVRRIPIPLELGFVQASSYADSTSPGELEIHFVPRESDLVGRHVLLVDDILDSGRTLSELSRVLQERGAADVSTCVLLDKPSRRQAPFRADFVGFEIDDVFVVGYGLDHAGRYRNLPHVGCLRPELLNVGTAR